MSWLSEGIKDVGNFWNSQPNWAKGLELGVGGLALGGIGAGLAGFGPLAGVFGGEAGLGGAAATTGGIDAITTGSAVGAAGAGGIDYAGGVGAMSLGLNPSVLGGGGGLADAGGLGGLGGVTDPEALAQLQAAGYSQPTFASAASDTSGIAPGANIDAMTQSGTGLSKAGSYSTFDPFGGGTTINTGGDPQAAANFLSTGSQQAAKPSAWSFEGIGNSLTPATSLGAALGIGGLGYNMYQGYQQQQQLKALQDSITQQSTQNADVAKQAQENAQPEMALGTSLQNPLVTDTLPASAQASIDQQVQEQKAKIISGYAQRGMSADPNQNSALAGDLANLDQQALSLKNTLETNYFNAGQQAIQSANAMIAAGLSASQISAQLPIQMQQLDMQLASATSTSIAAFAKGLTPSGGQSYTLQPA